jgi:type IV secretion system protein VirB6
MASVCENALSEMGGGIAAALRAIDCLAQDGSADIFGALFASGGFLETLLVILLTCYVIFFGFSLVLGRSNLNIRSLVPRMVTIGLVLTFATSWVAYQGLVWNLFVSGPEWMASALTNSEGSATLVFGEKLDVVFAAVQEASQGQENFEAFSPPGIMWLGAVFLLLGTVGVLATSKIALLLLITLGPIFVVMALFNSTRGLFVGWLKGLVFLGLTPLFAILGGTIMLELAVPVLSTLVSIPGQVSPRAAMAFFLIGAVHVALMFMVLKVAVTIVSGWRVFGFDPVSDFAKSNTEHRPYDGRGSLKNTSIVEGIESSGAQRVLDMKSAANLGFTNNDSLRPSARTLGINRTEQETSGVSNSANDSYRGKSRTYGIGSRFRNERISMLSHRTEPKT